MNNLTDQKAIPFVLPSAIGQPVTLADYTGSWLLLVFHRHLG